MSIILILIPLLAAFAILAGIGKAKSIATIAATANLALGLGTVFCWRSSIWGLSWEVL
jgi:hypothetical protein